MHKCPKEVMSFQLQQMGEPGTTAGYQHKVTHRLSNSKPIGQLVTKIGRYLFDCCGAYEIAGLFGSMNPDVSQYGYSGVAVSSLSPDVLIRKKQDFLASVLNAMGGYGKSYFFIITTAQLRQFAGKDSLYALLMEMGAIKIDQFPNQNHAGNDLHMHRWAPNLNRDRIAAYVTMDQDQYPMYFNPNWWVNSTPEEREAILKQYPVKSSAQIEKEEYDTLQAQRAEEARQAKMRFLQHAHYYPDSLREAVESYRLRVGRDILPSNNVITEVATVAKRKTTAQKA